MSYKMSYDSNYGCTTLYDKSKVAKSHNIVECIGNIQELCAELEIIKLHVSDEDVLKALGEITTELQKLVVKPIKTDVNTTIIDKGANTRISDPMTKALINRCVAVARRAERYLAQLKVSHYDVTQSALIFMNFLPKYLHDLAI